MIAVRKSWILGFAGGSYIDYEREGRAEDSKVLWPEQPQDAVINEEGSTWTCYI